MTGAHLARVAWLGKAGGIIVSMPELQLTTRNAPIDATLLARSVDGHEVPAGSTLGDLLDAGADRTTLLVFLRHYG